jgi:flagellar motor component MotA
MGGFIIDAFLMMFTEQPVREIDKTYRQIAEHFARYVIGSGVIGAMIGLISVIHRALFVRKL